MCGLDHARRGNSVRRHSQRERFVNSVTKGKNQMPPWGGLLKPEEIEALWLYVIAGERG